MQPTLIREQFVREFGEDQGIVVGRAPGRVNLIGEHTDYNGGFVFPMAIDFAIGIAARLRTDRRFLIYSVDNQERVEIDLDKSFSRDTVHGWSNYPQGVAWALREAGIELPGLEVAFGGDIPQGAGLSSSAALEVATAIVCQELTGFSMTPPELAVLCQKAENGFVGMNCGIMDQFISMMGRQDHALFLDCRSLNYKNVPLTLGDYRVVICHSGVKHSLVDSEYNQRRRECEAGVAALGRRFPGIFTLRDAKMDQLEACREEMDPTVFRRCRHVIKEIDRTVESVDSLYDGNLYKFGELMNASHDSLRDDYSVSCHEIDRLVDLAREVKDVLGSRITGGGFGGCTVSLVASGSIQEFKRHVSETYQAETGIEPKIYVSSPANGAEILE